MSIKAILEIDGNTHNIKDLSWGVSKNADYNGYPNGKGYLRDIFLTIEAIRDNTFEDWSLSDKMRKDFKIIMTPNIEGTQPTRILNCYDGYLVSMRTHFNSDSNSPMQFNLRISCGGFEPSYSTTKYSRWWRKSYPTDHENSPHNQEDLEAIINESFYESKDGKKVQKLRKNREIYLVVLSDNMTGKYIDIDLSDDSYNFEYQGEVIQNDLLENIKITSDRMRIPLTTKNKK